MILNQFFFGLVILTRNLRSLFLIKNHISQEFPFDMWIDVQSKLGSWLTQYFSRNVLKWHYFLRPYKRENLKDFDIRRITLPQAFDGSNTVRPAVHPDSGIRKQPSKFKKNNIPTCVWPTWSDFLIIIQENWFLYWQRK